MSRIGILCSIAAISLLCSFPGQSLAQSPVQAQLTPQEREGLNSALYMANLTEDDLGYEKKADVDPYRLSLNSLALDKPLEAFDRLFKLHSQLGQSLSDNLREGARVTFEESAAGNRDLPTLGPLPEDVPDELREPVEILIGGIDECNRAVHQATQKLNPSEQRELIEGLPIWLAANPQVHFGFTGRTEASQDRMLELLAKVDLPSIRAAGIRLSYVVESQVPELKRLAATIHLTTSLRFVLRGYRVEISAEDGGLHASRDTNLFIGLGDRNHYTGRFGAGIGYSSVLIDCGNQSYYDVPDMSIGAGVLGVGLAYTTGVGDVFRGRAICFGAGIAGVGAMVHNGSDSTFRAGSLCEGFGSFGEGILQDDGDRNTFQADTFCQGAARTQGLGWLIERGSYCSFDAAGLTVVESRNAAISCSQGFAGGFGNDDSLLSGGVGLVTTTGSNESYFAGIRCQGAAVWGGVGSIFDMGSRATHVSAQESQAYANHEGGAFVYNLGGFATYTARFGTCQSCAGSSSVALLLDRGGHNLYSSKEGHPATGLKNGLALLLNSGPGDNFLKSPESNSLSGGLALFCDVGSGTRYSSSISPSPVLASPDLMVYSQPTGQSEVSLTTGGTTQVFVPGSAPNPGEAQLAAEWRRAKLGGSDGRRALDGLVAIGVPAAEFVLKTQLGNWTTESAVPMAELVRRIGPEARKLLALEVNSPGSLRAQNALRLACLAPGAGMDSAIVTALGSPSLQRMAVRAAGRCQVHSAVSALLPLCASQDANLALQAMVALSEIGDEGATGTAAACLASKSWPMRRAAISLLSKFPNEAVAAASGLLASTMVQQQRTGVQLIAALPEEDAVKRLGHLLDSPSQGVQLEALLALNGRVPENLRSKVADLQGSRDPYLKLAALGISMDR